MPRCDISCLNLKLYCIFLETVRMRSENAQCKTTTLSIDGTGDPYNKQSHKCNMTPC
jgi:hypothetical protein